MSAASAVPVRNLAPRSARTTRAPRDYVNYLFPSRKFDPDTNEPRENAAAVPHLFWTLIGRNLITGGAQLTVLGYIMARTWGDKRRLAWARIPVSDIVRETKFGKTTVEEALLDLVARGLVAARKESCGVYARGVKPDGWEKKKGAAVDYRVDVAFWPKAAKCAEEELHDPEPAAAEDSAEEIPDAKAGEPVALKPREIRSVSIQLAPDRPLLRLTCQNRAALPLAFSARASFGSVRLSFFEVGKAGDVAVNHPATVDRIRCKPNKTRDRLSNFSATSASAAPGKPCEADLDAIASLLRQHFNQPRDDAFAGRVLGALDGAPSAQLQEFAAREIPAMRAKRKPVVSGILLFFAEKVGMAWREARMEREAEAAAGQLRAKDGERTHRAVIADLVERTRANGTAELDDLRSHPDFADIIAEVENALKAGAL